VEYINDKCTSSAGFAIANLLLVLWAEDPMELWDHVVLASLSQKMLRIYFYNLAICTFGPCYYAWEIYINWIIL